MDDPSRKRGKDAIKPPVETLPTDSPATPAGKKPAVAMEMPPPAPVFTTEDQKQKQSDADQLLSKQSELIDTNSLANEFGIAENTGLPPSTPEHRVK